MITKTAGCLLLGGMLLSAVHEVTAADSLRCPNGLVDQGALKVEVLAACGEPVLQERWFDGLHNGFVPTEQWTYDFGANQFLRLLQFRQGRLVSVSSEGYGFAGTGVGQCQPRQISEGMSSYRLLRICGEPASRDAIQVLAPPRPLLRPPQNYPQTVVPIQRELWVYNFGSRHFLREVTLENGRVVQVANGRRGFD